MDTFAVRLANLTALATRYPMRRDLASALDRDESQLSRYLGGGCRIGHNFARHVEARLTLPHGWMDTTHTHQPFNPLPLQQSLQRFIDSSPDQQLADTIANLLTLIADKK